jgi:hypothetical protein
MPQVKWNDNQYNQLLDQLLAADRAGKRADNGWKKETWEGIKIEINTTFNMDFTLDQLKNAYQLLKKKYQIVKQLRDLSGFGWNNDLQIVTASSEVWEDYLKRHPKATPFRTTSFLQFDKMQSLVEGRIATGNRALQLTDIMSTTGTSYSQ